MSDADSDPVPVHHQISPLSFLLGRWIGEGTGHYPTITSFSYGEEIRFAHVGKPFLSYGQRTWSLEDGRPLHAETGFLRSGDNGRVEMVLAHATGVVEVDEGTLVGTTLELRSTMVGLTHSAKEVEALARRITVDGDVLRYTLAMGAVGVPLQDHLAAELRRAG
ncbi:MAG: nitrobindin family protein [Acidimicrobiales bacterium]